MPAHDRVELMRVQIRDGESLIQFSGGKSRAQVLAEALHAKRTVAIVPVKVSRNEAIHTSRDSEADPGLQHLAPMRVVQARPILAHAANAIVLIRDRFSQSVLLQQFNRVRDGLL